MHVDETNEDGLLEIYGSNVVDNNHDQRLDYLKTLHVPPQLSRWLSQTLCSILEVLGWALPVILEHNARQLHINPLSVLVSRR